MAETQQTIPGTADVPTARVVAAGEEYSKLFRSRAAIQAKENDARATLIELMEEDHIETFTIGNEQVTLETSAKTRIKLETLKEEK